MEEYKIPLRNKNKEIIDYTYVSKEDYEILSQYKWHKNPTGYAHSTFNNKNNRMHRYIMIEILKNNINSKIPIDHIDNNRLNNKRENLRIVTYSENTRNRTKLQNTSSEYIGVCWHKQYNKWISYIKYNKKQYNSYYNNEHHAAHQYNLWCYEFNLTTANLNIIPEEYIKNFILYKTQDKLNDLPKYINLSRNNTYCIYIKKKYYGTYKTLLEAINIRDIKLKEIENKKQEDIKKQPIKRNKEGQAIIEIFNKDKQKIAETIVDDSDYYNLIHCSWHIYDKYYINNSKLGRLHRYIMNYNGKDFIDHINNNPLDNRKENLRIVTPTQNNMNRKSNKKSSSKYIGVFYDKIGNKWRAYIKINNKNIHLGCFTNEEDAAKARDDATLKYFGEYGNLNFGIIN